MADTEGAKVPSFIRFPNMRDILAELEESRATQIANKIEELIRNNTNADRSIKLDGFAGNGKKDGGKDCGTDGKEGKEDSEGKESCDPEGDFLLIYGDPAKISTALLNAAVARQAARLNSLLAGDNVII